MRAAERSQHGALGQRERGRKPALLRGGGLWQRVHRHRHAADEILADLLHDLLKALLHRVPRQRLRLLHAQLGQPVEARLAEKLAEPAHDLLGGDVAHHLVAHAGGGPPQLGQPAPAHHALGDHPLAHGVQNAVTHVGGARLGAADHPRSLQAVCEFADPAGLLRPPICLHELGAVGDAAQGEPERHLAHARDGALQKSVEHSGAVCLLLAQSLLKAVGVSLPIGGPGLHRHTHAHVGVGGRGLQALHGGGVFLGSRSGRNPRATDPLDRPARAEHEHQLRGGIRRVVHADFQLAQLEQRRIAPVEHGGDVLLLAVEFHAGAHLLRVGRKIPAQPEIGGAKGAVRLLHKIHWRWSTGKIRQPLGDRHPGAHRGLSALVQGHGNRREHVGHLARDRRARALLPRINQAALVDFEPFLEAGENLPGGHPVAPGLVDELTLRGAGQEILALHPLARQAEQPERRLDALPKTRCRVLAVGRRLLGLDERIVDRIKPGQHPLLLKLVGPAFQNLALDLRRIAPIGTLRVELERAVDHDYRLAPETPVVRGLAGHKARPEFPRILVESLAAGHGALELREPLLPGVADRHLV